jgi:hypothetical protein
MRRRLLLVCGLLVGAVVAGWMVSGSFSGFLHAMMATFTMANFGGL